MSDGLNHLPRPVRLMLFFDAAHNELTAQGDYPLDDSLNYFPRPVDLMRFCDVAYDELTAQDAYPLICAVNAAGNMLTCRVGFGLSQAYRRLGLIAADTALMLKGSHVFDPEDLAAMAEAQDFRRPPGLAGGGIALFNGAGGELIGAVGVIATSSTGHAPNSRQVCELVRDVATAHRFGVSPDIN